MNSDDFTRKRIIRSIKLFWLMALLCSVRVYAEPPDTQLNRAFNKGRFVLPVSDELLRARRAYQMELAGQSADELWNALAMQRISQADLLYFREAPSSRTGRGLFAMHGGVSVRPWLLQAPHARSDKFTGRIVERMFSEGGFKAAMWNSVPRKTRVENSVMEGTADMAHLSGTYWQAVTESFARYYDAGKIFQFHGYAQSKRKSAAGRNSDMILSAGHRYPPLWIQDFAQCLKKSLPGKISLYPYDVKELGATTNIQGQMLRNLGFKGFLHIEMSKSMRQQLLHRQDLRKLLLGCIR